MRTVIVIILLLLSNIGYSQNKNKGYDLYINSKTGVSSSEFSIAIKKTRKSTKIIYSKLDSVDHARLGQDKEFEEISRSYFGSNYPDHPTSPEGKEFTNRLEKLTQKYSVYTKDSIELENNRNGAYIKSLDELYLADEASLLREKELKGRIVLDGSLVYVILKSEGKVEKDFFVQSPSNDSHPLIHKLMDDSLKLYRAMNPNSSVEWNTRVPIKCMLNPRSAAGFAYTNR